MVGISVPRDYRFIVLRLYPAPCEEQPVFIHCIPGLCQISQKKTGTTIESSKMNTNLPQKICQNCTLQQQRYGESANFANIAANYMHMQ